jgi:putative tryptophan/tyrosine transport system substrate-binding protein
MNRRTFIVTGAGLLAAPLAGGAQQPAKVPRIGILSAGAASTREAAFRQGLRDLGYSEGQNVLIEARYAGGRFEKLPELAGELARLDADVIVASPTEAIRAAQRATKSIPIVMAFSGDPVGSGIIASLAQPGGTVTGLTSVAPELTAKRLEFLKVIAPELLRVSFLVNQATPKRFVSETEVAGRALGVQVTPVMVQDTNELDRVFSAIARPPVGGLVVDLVLHEYRRRIADLAIRHRLPAISGPKEFAEAGGLMAYGPDYPDLFRRAATYVDKILKGAKPADLPVEQPTKFELIINLKTAKALGLTIPPSLLLRADQVIE